MAEIDLQKASFLTDAKRVRGLGASGGGTAHHRATTYTSVALAVLVPLFLLTFGRILGAPLPEVIAYYQRPFPAIVAILTLGIGWWHFAQGVQVLLEDYTRGQTRKWSTVAAKCLSLFAAAAGVYALIRIAL